MATIRRLNSGSWQAQVRRKGVALSRCCHRRRDAEVWARETESRIDRGETPSKRSKGSPTTFGHLIDLHIEDMKEVGKAPRRSKAAVLNTLKADLGRVKLKDLTRERLIEFGRERAKAGAGPATLSVDLSYMRTLIVHAAAVHGVDISVEPVTLARAALKRLGLVGKGRERDRRPTADELARICADAEANPLQVIPLARLIRFAVATAMRQEEICEVLWSDLDREARTLLVRNRKDPRHKVGNHQRVPLLKISGFDALALLDEQRAATTSRGRIFPYNPKSVGTAFRRICRRLKIEDLHFHDLRHEGTSRLFEGGLDIPQAALVTGHKDWKMLKRYTHIQPSTLHKRLEERAKEASKGQAGAASQAAFSSAMALIVEDPLLSGAPRFRGTSVLVHPIADLLHRGVPEATILADFPDLTPDMLVAARLHCALARGPSRAQIA